MNFFIWQQQMNNIFLLQQISCLLNNRDMEIWYNMHMPKYYNLYAIIHLIMLKLYMKCVIFIYEVVNCPMLFILHILMKHMHTHHYGSVCVFDLFSFPDLGSIHLSLSMILRSFGFQRQMFIKFHNLSRYYRYLSRYIVKT